MNEYKPEDIVNRLRQTVNNGRLGKEYTVIPREKNNQLREKYLIDDEKVDEILLGLCTDDYIGSENSRDEFFTDDIVHIFGKKEYLLLKCSKEPEEVQAKLYIKFTWTKNGKNGLIIISFHEWNQQ